MEDWELEFEWLRVKHIVKDAFGKKDLPDLQAILFLIGIQELGDLRQDFSKEEKQDLMHIAVCSLLEEKGFFAFKGRDEDGWPHWEQIKALKLKGVEEQERMLKERIIQYFHAMETLNGGYESE